MAQAGGVPGMADDGNKRIHLIRFGADALCQAVFLVLGEMVEIQVHLACKVNELDIQFGFRSLVLVVSETI